jgi:hypothetical protein
MNRKIVYATAAALLAAGLLVTVQAASSSADVIGVDSGSGCCAN